MKKFKLTKSSKTLFRHTISDLANFSDPQMSEQDSGDHELDLEAKHLESPCELPVECEVRADSADRAIENDCDWYEHSTRVDDVEQMHDEMIDVENQIGWRWLNYDSDSDSDSHSDDEDKLLTERNLTESLANWATTYRVHSSHEQSIHDS